MSATARQLKEYVDRSARLKVEELTFEVTTLDAKECYGTVRVEVRPKAGTGTKWVLASRLTFQDGPQPCE